MIRILLIIFFVGMFTGANARIKHPSLLFTPEKISEANRRISTDSIQQKAWYEIQTTADALLEKNDVKKMEYIVLAYQMTGEQRYCDKLREMLMAISEIPVWEDQEMVKRKPAWRSELQMAHKAFQIAVAYDGIYNTLSNADRGKIAEGVWRLAGEPLLGDWILEPSRIHSLNSMGHNWWTSCVCMGGILAIAISNEVPEAAIAAKQAIDVLPEWFDFAGDVLQGKPRTFDRAGGMYESINYANFGITEALLLRLAWLNSHPGEKLEEISNIELLPEFFASVCYPRTGILYSINFGDSHKNITGESSLILANEIGVKDSVTLWYLNQIEAGQHAGGYPRSCPMGFLYTPNFSDAPVSPKLPTSKIWKDFGWATMRDSWQKDATMLAVKSGATWNHSHADANSFILFHKGVDIIKDGGHCWYPNPEYRNYFFQSQAHNVVLFDGEGQPRYQQYHGTLLPGSLHYLIDGNGVKYVLADGTGPMSHLFDRNLRSFLWIDNIVFVIDDIHSHKPGKFEWLWHPNGIAKKNGYNLEVTNGESQILIRPIFPEPLAASNFVHDYPESLWWEEIEVPGESLKGTDKYWSFHLPAITDRVKGVTAIILNDSINQKVQPQLKRKVGENWIGIQIENGDTITDLYINQLADGRLMHLNSWIEADGWTTDAYMFAVTYHKNGNPSKPDRIFINHGSSLRLGKNVYFSSLSKLNAVYNPNNRDMKLEVNGQPRFSLRVKSDAKNIDVNGTKFQAINRDGLFLIKIHND